MKRSFWIAALSLLICAPASLAQQGPAGVPGVIEFVGTLFAPAQKADATGDKAAADPCTANPKSEVCKQKRAQRKAIRAKALASCKGTTGDSHTRCVSRQEEIEACHLSDAPILCERQRAARETCQNLEGSEHMRCLRRILAP